jgi:hypothetical protein
MRKWRAAFGKVRFPHVADIIRSDTVTLLQGSRSMRFNFSDGVVGVPARLRKLSAAALLGLAGATLVSAAPAAMDDANQLRARRLAYSAAIEARRGDLMRNFIASDMVQLSSSGDTAIGADAIVKSYSTQEFIDPTFIAYERIPDTITIADNHRFAVERGHWRGRFRLPNGTVDGNSGLYQAGWIKRTGIWWIRTESYVRLHCTNERDCPK